MEETVGNFVVTFPLNIEKYQSDIIDDRMEMLRRAHNVIVGTYNRRYREMVKTKRWRETVAELFQSEKRSELYKQRKEFEKDSEDYIQITKQMDELKTKLSPERKKELTTIQKEILKQNGFNGCIIIYSQSTLKNKLIKSISLNIYFVFTLKDMIVLIYQTIQY